MPHGITEQGDGSETALSGLLGGNSLTDAAMDGVVWK